MTRPTLFRFSIASLLTLSITAAYAQTKFGNDKVITPARLKAHLELIASDELEGRNTPSRGLDVATQYVATQLKLWGAKPAGDNGTFFQKMNFYQFRLEPRKSVIRFGGSSYIFGDGIRGANKGCVASGKLVYVGHGWLFKKKNIDPYAGIDVKGKIMVVARGLPKGASYGDMQGTEGVDYAWPALAAKKLGAVGILTVTDAFEERYWDTATALEMGAFDLSVTPNNEIGNIVIGSTLARAIFQGEQITGEQAAAGLEAPEKSFDLSASKSIELNVVEEKVTKTASNVVAIIPGSDPKLKSEYVAFGAHIDHVGVSKTGDGDRIFNGADDDGSGTVSILEIAHAFLTGLRPKRSCLFVWHVGEERGLWGSAYYTDHPTVDLSKVIAQLNVDMIGRSKPTGDVKPSNKLLTGPSEIYVVGSTKMSTDLQKVSESVNAGYLKLKFNYRYDDPKDTEQIFYRSDHFNYARKGVPIMFYFDGVHEDYHQPGDEVSKIDFTKMSKVARTIYVTGLTLANQAKRPVVDKPLKY